MRLHTDAYPFRRTTSTSLVLPFQSLPASDASHAFSSSRVSQNFIHRPLGSHWPCAISYPFLNSPPAGSPATAFQPLPGSLCMPPLYPTARIMYLYLLMARLLLVVVE